MTIAVNQAKVTAAQDEEASRAAADTSTDKAKRLLFEINFNQENRIRVLEAKPAITRIQYRDALIALYKTL